MAFIDYKTQYLTWLDINMCLTKLSDTSYMLSTSFLDRYNDGIVIYIVENGDKIILSDDGYTLSEFKENGISCDVQNILKAYGANEGDDGELQLVTDKNNVGIKLHFFIQLLIILNNWERET